jgi:hypothetical protein
LKRFSFGNSSDLFSPPRETSAVPLISLLCANYQATQATEAMQHYRSRRFSAKIVLMAIPTVPIFPPKTKPAPSESPTADSPDSVIFPRHFPSQPITEYSIAPRPRCSSFPHSVNSENLVIPSCFPKWSKFTGSVTRGLAQPPATAPRSLRFKAADFRRGLFQDTRPIRLQNL